MGHKISLSGIERRYTAEMQNPHHANMRRGRCKILKGVVSKDHVHIHIEYPTKLLISDLMKRLKGRTSRVLQMEFPELKKRYWGQHFWAISYGAWSTGNITEELVQEYLEHHRNPSNQDTGKMILE